MKLLLQRILTWLASFRLRLLFRTAFALLACASVGLALVMLQQEKQLSYDNYQHGFAKTRQQIAATLRHPAGQLALLNPPPPRGTPIAHLHPILLPYAGLDFDDQGKVQQAIAMSGCLRQYGARGALCVGMGNNPWSGGFIYVAGNFNSAQLVSHQRGSLVQDGAHRVRVTVKLRGQEYVWLAPFEGESGAKANLGARGRFTGFWAHEADKPGAKPVKEFRGWIWQKAVCNQTELDERDPACEKNAFFSLRLPIPVLQDALFEKKRPQWPPPDLTQIAVHLQVFPPGTDQALFDSALDASDDPFALSDLEHMLLPGEVLRIRRQGQNEDLFVSTGRFADEDEAWPWLLQLVRALPVDTRALTLQAKEEVNTTLDNYELQFTGDVRSANRALVTAAMRVAWFVLAMLCALIFTWLVIEIGLIRRISRLTRRTTALSRSVRGSEGLDKFDVSDLRGSDEMGILASCLHDLLRRVQEDVKREEIRAEQEKQMWHAVGHEIMSPLQSLLALHGSEHDPSWRYIQRMQQAVRVLYGSASPSEAFQSTVLQVEEVDIAAFLQNVAANAPMVGIGRVEYLGSREPVPVRADEYSLEDVVTHVLRNAERFRDPDSVITLALQCSETAATITIHNHGPQIAPDMLEKIFEYGVSDQLESGAHGNRGQGLFVAKTYMAKMGGTISAMNVEGGVSFVLSLQRVA